MLSDFEKVQICKMNSVIKVAGLKGRILSTDGEGSITVEADRALYFFQDRVAIKNLKVYDITLKVMYNRQSRSDVYRVAMDYLVNSGVVESFFPINGLIQNFKIIEK